MTLEERVTKAEQDLRELHERMFGLKGMLGDARRALESALRDNRLLQDQVTYVQEVCNTLLDEKRALRDELNALREERESSP